MEWNGTGVPFCLNPPKWKHFEGYSTFVPLALQVDIFSLGTCLYELMSLRPLPPKDISEGEYKNMLKIGKRPGFSTKVK